MQCGSRNIARFELFEMRGILRWTQRLLFASGAVLLGYCGYVAADSWVFQERESRDFQRRLLAIPSTQHSPVVAYKGLIGRLEIPRLGLSVILMEGDEAKP